MERALYADLVAWKTSPRRKPLILRGARQTGKTFLLRRLAEREYDRVAYCNFEADPGLEGFFRRDLDPHRIVAELSIYKGVDLRPGHDLIVFDEVQASNLALSSLKYFQEQANDYRSGPGIRERAQVAPRCGAGAPLPCGVDEPQPAVVLRGSKLLQGLRSRRGAPGCDDGSASGAHRSG